MNSNSFANPYITTRFVSGGDFFNREEEISQILVNLESEDNVLIIEGQRRIGKTSLLRHLEQHILTRSPQENSSEFGITQTQTYFPVFLNMETYSSKTDALINFQSAIIKDIEKKFNISFPNRDLFEPDQLILYVSNTLEEKKLTGIILFDEFDLLSGTQISLEVINILNWLNEVFIITRSQRLKWVLSIGQKLSRLVASYDPIVKSRIPVRLSLFDKKWTEIILKSPKLFQFQTNAIAEIYSLTRGHPLLVQAFGSSLFRDVYIEENRTAIKVSDVHDIITKILNDRSSAILSIVRVPEVEKNLLLAISTLRQDKGKIANLKSITEILGQQNISIKIEEVTAAVNHLKSWEILKGDSQSLNFIVPLIQRWIYENWSFVSKENRESFSDFNEELAENRYQIAKRAEEKQQYDEAKKNYGQAIDYFPTHLASWQRLLDLEDNTLERIKITEKLYSLKPDEYRKKLIQAKKIYADQLEENADLIGAAKQFCELENIADFWDQEVQRLALRVLSSVLLHLQNPLFEQDKDLIQRDLKDIREIIKLTDRVNFVGDNLPELYHVRNKLIEMSSKPRKENNSFSFNSSNQSNTFVLRTFKILAYLLLFGLSAILIIMIPTFGIIFLLLSLWLSFFLDIYLRFQKRF